VVVTLVELKDIQLPDSMERESQPPGTLLDAVNRRSNRSTPMPARRL